ncbi:hypothetical protein GBZ48_18405 [Azospirillum melinis]|uniref:Transposase n=1 Tax=Azospirillum melinis TaxID=328839 RepID=A0ABX2KFE7_9PROT|nr:hypothetical protein [Azospirillum melinis]MBP2309723.1 hypothetical protein [Azospirillum melinis]NUB01242.1 hypothetical protein [Azospirillum melinis]
MIGEVVHGCRVRFRESVAKTMQARTRAAVTVQHTGVNRVRSLFTKGKSAVLKSLTAKDIEIAVPDGRDLVAAWRGQRDRLPGAVMLEDAVWNRDPAVPPPPPSVPDLSDFVRELCLSRMVRSRFSSCRQEMGGYRPAERELPQCVWPRGGFVDATRCR